jgi:diadenosine tetraphosphate (Ap4A) HIT family hydrolase
MNAVYRTVSKERIDGLRQNARFFTKITVKGDWSNERVVHHDALVTAFLDMSDPEHPRYDRQNVDEDELIARLPESRRAHVLVIPNQPREHIAPSVSGVITLDDINATRAVLESAHQVAKDLGIKNPRIYFNTADRLTVGYLHVHVVGERDGRAYPRLAPE